MPPGFDMGNPPHLFLSVSPRVPFLAEQDVNNPGVGPGSQYKHVFLARPLYTDTPSQAATGAPAAPPAPIGLAGGKPPPKPKPSPSPLSLSSTTTGSSLLGTLLDWLHRHPVARGKHHAHKPADRAHLLRLCLDSNPEADCV